MFPEDLMGFLDGKASKVEAIVHHGRQLLDHGRPGGDAIIRTNLQYLDLKLLDWCSEHGVPLVYASSAATYGDGGEGLQRRAGARIGAAAAWKPLNLYGWSKHHVRPDSRRTRGELGLALPPKCIGLKFFNVFGQNEYHRAT